MLLAIELIVENRRLLGSVIALEIFIGKAAGGIQILSLDILAVILQSTLLEIHHISLFVTVLRRCDHTHECFAAPDSLDEIIERECLLIFLGHFTVHNKLFKLP